MPDNDRLAVIGRCFDGTRCRFDHDFQQMSQTLSITSPGTDGRWKVRLIGTLLSGALLVGCCSRAAKRDGDGATEPPRLAVWFANPDRYLGAEISVGGRVLNATDDSLELLAYPGNDCGEADFAELPVGRILVKSPLALVPAHFPPGRETTVIGRIAGLQTTETGGIRRELPVVEAVELTTPAPPAFFPLLRFGFGFSGGF